MRSNYHQLSFKSSSLKRSPTINPSATGNTLLCGRIFQPAKDITIEIVMSKHFLVILKRPLQNDGKIVKRCFFVTAES